MVLSSSDAKKMFFLTTEDLKSVPRETMYFGFGTGRATNIFQESDLKAAAIAKYGEEGFTKKLAARIKREENKRKREEEKAKVVAGGGGEAHENAKKQKCPGMVIVVDPNLAKKEKSKKERLAKSEEKRKQKASLTLKRNQQIAGDAWKLTMVHPETVAGTAATLVIKSLPPTPGDATIFVRDITSPAFSFGNIYGFKGDSSEADEKMIFETKWKVFGERHTGKLTVSVKPSDNEENVERTSVDEHDATICKAENEIKADHDHAKSGGSQEEEEEERRKERLMVIGTFNCGVSGGVRIWKFKGYRDE